MKKNLLTVLLTVLMSMVGVKAHAYDFSKSNSEGKTIFYSFIGGDEVAVAKGYYAYSGRIVIPRQVYYNGSYYRVTSIAPYAFEDGKNVSYLYIPSSITSIGEFAFIDCGYNIDVNIEDMSAWCNTTLGNEHASPLSSADNLYVNGSWVRDLYIPYGVETVSNFTFYQCRCITSVSLPGTVRTIGSSAFEDCTNLSWVSLSEGLQTIGGSAFEGCTGLAAITLPSTVSEIQINAFNRCTNLNDITSLIMTPFPIDYSAFCTYDTATLTVPSGTRTAYRNTEGWYNFVKINDGTPSSSEFSRNSINYVVTSPNTVAVKSVSSYLHRVIIPETVYSNGTYYQVTALGDWSFQGREDITYLSIPSTITSIGEYAFIDCGSNIEVNIADLGAWCNVTFGNEHSSPLSSAKTFYLNGYRVTDLAIPYGVQSIPNFAFYQCRMITSLNIPGTVQTIGSSAFEDCTGLNWVSLQEGLETIGGSSFEGCTGLYAITIPSTVTEIQINAFNRCTNLNDITSLIRTPFAIDYSAFCTYDTATLTVPRGTKSAYQSTYGWNNFRNITDGTSDSQFARDGITYTVTSPTTVAVTSAAYYLKDVFIPEHVYNEGTVYQVTALAAHSFEGRADITYLSIPKTITSIGEYAFIDCGSNIMVNIESLEAWCNVTLGNEHSSPLSSAKAFYVNNVEMNGVRIPDGVTSIPNFSFYQCKSILYLIVPSSVKIIGSSAFEDCTSLSSVGLAEGLETIGGSAFEGCSGLSSITIPSTVTTIYMNAFNRCPNLVDITSEIQNPFAIESNVFSTYATAILRVPSGTRAAYMTTAGWNRFLNIVDDATGIEKVLMSTDGDDEIVIYGLNGQKVGSTSQRDFDQIWTSLSKGVYIVNGQKRIRQ